MLIPDLLRDQARKHPERTAVVVDGHGEMTYGEWDAGSNRLARALVARGLEPGDRVALWFGNEHGLDYLVSYQAIHKAGAVAVPLNTHWTRREIEHVLGHCEASALLCEADGKSVATIPLTIEGDALAAGMLDGDPSAFQTARAEDDLADLLYTSGTTGLPKGVACTHDSVIYKGSSKLHEWFAGATFLHAVPLFSFAGTHAMMRIPLRGGMTHVLQPRFDPARYLQLIDERKVAIAYAVPAMVLRCLELPQIGDGSYESLRLLMYGTAPMPPHAIRALGKTFPSTFLVNLYGLTEGGAAVCSLSPEEAQQRPGSIGKPVPPTEVRIVDGEIWLRAPVRPRSYYRDEAATATTWTADGWLRTGDVGRLDADGFLYLTGRKKDLIIVGGHNVSAPEVEGHLLEHPAVREAAVVGWQHPIMGEVPRAFVVLRGDVDGETLRAYLTERLADYKVPRDYEFVDELPRNALGKVLKRVLRGEGAHA